MMDVPETLFEEAFTLMCKRFPEGKGGAAAVCTETGTILTSVGLRTPNAPANLCRETGALLEAYKIGEKVTAVLCIMRDSHDEPVRVLTPCGICQERLFASGGGDILVAVPNDEDPSTYEVIRLDNLQPHYWAKHLTEEEWSHKGIQAYPNKISPRSHLKDT